MLKNPTLFATAVFCAVFVGFAIGALTEPYTPAPHPTPEEVWEKCQENVGKGYRIGYDRGQADAVFGLYQPDVRANTFRVRVLEDTTLSP